MKTEEFEEWYPLSEKEYKPVLVTIDATLVAKELADDYVYGLIDTRHNSYTEEYKKSLHTIWKVKYDYYLEKIKSKAHIQ